MLMIMSYKKNTSVCVLALKAISIGDVGGLKILF